MNTRPAVGLVVYPRWVINGLCSTSTTVNDQYYQFILRVTLPVYLHDCHARPLTRLGWVFINKLIFHYTLFEQEIVAILLLFQININLIIR